MTGRFAEVFGRPPTATGSAPARVNLMGEHTDYNGGFVLPTPLPYTTLVSVGPGDDWGTIKAHSRQFQQTLERSLDAPPHGDWLDYLLGCVAVLRADGVVMPGGLCACVESDVPMGAGLSSSAALEVATLRCLRAWLGFARDDQALAHLARRAETDYVGVPCGIMDQMVCSLGVPGAAFFLDTRDLTRAFVPLPTDHVPAVVHSGVAHRLSDGGYARRRTECEAARTALGVASLRDLDLADLPRIAALPEPLNRRVRHVVTENRRVLASVAALGRGDVPAFGALMDDSHRSQRDDFQVSVPEIDALVTAACRHGAVGARLTGGGFGGSIVALVAAEKVDPWWSRLAQACPNASLVHPRPARP